MNEQNEGKPFYKRNWFWIMILSIFIIVSATTYIANFSFYQGKADSTVVSQKKTKKTVADLSLSDKYNELKTGKTGYSKKEVIQLLGEPTSIQQIDDTSQVASLIWNKMDNGKSIVIQVTFEKGKASAKSIRGLDIDRKQLLTKKDYNKLQNGDNYNRVLNVLGDTDDYSDTNGIKTLIYESDLSEADPTYDATIKIEIANDKVISLEQQNLK